MMWRTPKEGDTRERRRFAWLPVDCEDGSTRWLEWLDVTQRYSVALTGYVYIPAEWVTISCRGRKPVA